jgi:DNA-binding transcriptional ArsR family regulator
LSLLELPARGGYGSQRKSVLELLVCSQKQLFYEWALGSPAGFRDAHHHRQQRRSGQTLVELCAPLDMTRRAVTRHLDLLEAANLVGTGCRGREKLHFLNPLPLQEIYEHWIAKFEKPRLKATFAAYEINALARKLSRATMRLKPKSTMATAFITS